MLRNTSPRAIVSGGGRHRASGVGECGTRVCEYMCVGGRHRGSGVGWAKYVRANVCGAAEQPDCDATGNAIFDGGSDMYDIGNFMSTSLMGTCTEDPHGCPLGSLQYRSDFQPADTECFGPGGSYQMAQLEDTVWLFLAHNSGDDPLDFMIIGNLGSDGSGTVTEFVLEAPPFAG